MHVGHHDRRWTLRTLQHAGGVVGVGVGAPLRAGLGSAGAVIVLLAVGLLGALLVVGTGLRQVGHGLHLGARFVGRHASTLMAMPRSDEDVDDDVDSPADIDLRAWQQPEPAAPDNEELATLDEEDDDAAYEEEGEEDDEYEYEDEDDEGECEEEEDEYED